MSAYLKFVLWGALNSGHSYKVRMFLMLGDINHRYEAVSLSVPRQQRAAEFQEIARFGEVPVLQIGDEAITQSNAILLRLARETGLFGWNSAAECSLVESWLFWEANRIGRSYPNLRYCRLFDHSADAGLKLWFERTAADDLDQLNHELAGQNFLLGRVTIADLSCAGYLLYGDDPELDLSKWPHVAAWLDRIRALPGWEHPLEVMGK